MNREEVVIAEDFSHVKVGGKEVRLSVFPDGSFVVGNLFVGPPLEPGAAAQWGGSGSGGGGGGGSGGRGKRTVKSPGHAQRRTQVGSPGVSGDPYFWGGLYADRDARSLNISGLPHREREQRAGKKKEAKEKGRGKKTSRSLKREGTWS